MWAENNKLKKKFIYVYFVKYFILASLLVCIRHGNENNNYVTAFSFTNNNLFTIQAE